MGCGGSKAVEISPAVTNGKKLATQASVKQGMSTFQKANLL